VQLLRSVRGVYYGAASSDPTVDPNGDPPDVGDMYWNTTGSGSLRIFNGTVWVPLPDGYLTEADLARNGGTIPETNDENFWDAPQRFEGPMQDHLVFQRLGTGQEYGIGVGTFGGNHLSLGPVPGAGKRVTINEDGELNAEKGLYDSGNRVLAAKTLGAIVARTWTARTVPDGAWRDVTWSAELGLFVAVATTGTDRVMTSPDGVAWTARTVPDGTWQGVTWSAELGLFVAVATTGTDPVMTSPDGVAWTARTVPDGSWQDVTWSAELGLFVAVASFGTDHRVMTSL